jgi:AcrR family transcriptional regulator
MEEVARATGVSKGLVYNHYPTKDALITEYVKRAAETSGYFIKAVADSGASAFVKINQVSAVMHEMIATQSPGVDFFMFMIQVNMSGFPVPEAVGYSKKLPDPLDSMARIIAQGQGEGSCVQGEPRQLSVAYWALIQGLCCYAISGETGMAESRMLSRVLLKEEYL